MPVVEHISEEVEPRARGEAFGEERRGQVRHTAEVYARLFAESAGHDAAAVSGFGAEVRRELMPKFPTLLSEIDGIAAGAGLDADTLVAINARTELLASGKFSGGGVPADGASRQCAECSHVALLPDSTCEGGTLLGQTWDFHPDLAPSRVLWQFPLGDERWAVTFTEAGILAKAGMNTDHVGITMAFLATEADEALGGVPVHMIARLALEGSRNASDALRTFYGVRSSASVALTIAFAGESPASFAVTAEFSPRGIQLIYPDDMGILVHTNHFVSDPGVQDLALTPDGWHGTLVRRDFLIRSLRRAARRNELDTSELRRLFKSRFNAPESVCTFAERKLGPWYREVETMATVIFDLGHGTVNVDDGANDNGPAMNELRIVNLP